MRLTRHRMRNRKRSRLRMSIYLFIANLLVILIPITIGYYCPENLLLTLFIGLIQFVFQRILDSDFWHY